MQTGVSTSLVPQTALYQHGWCRAASPDPDEVVVHTPFGDAKLHPPSLPDVQMPSPSPEQAEAIAQAQRRVGQVIGALSQFHSELKSSARIMFD